MLFNPAKANFEAYDLNIDDYDSEMISYVVDGEILSKILAVLPLESPAKEVIIGEKGLLGKLYDTMPIEQILTLPDSIKNHLIDGVIESLNETEEEKWKENLRYLLKIISPLLSWFV